MSETKTCEIPDEIVDAFRKFKLSKSKTNNVLILKINTKKLLVELEDELEDVDFEDLAEELPEATPRYIVMSYRWEMELDRVSYPLVFIYYNPPGLNPKVAMCYSSTKSRLSRALDLNKEFDLRDREDLTAEWLAKKLNFFKC